MAIIAERKASAFTPMTEGVVEAVAAEVTDLGVLPTAYGPKQTVAVRFVDAEGNEASKLYTPSLSEKANLFKDLTALNIEFDQNYDMEQMVGLQVRLVISEYTNKKGHPAAKIEKVMKPSKGQNVAIPEKYRAPKKAAAAQPKKAAKATKAQAAAVEAALDITDDDIPF